MRKYNEQVINNINATNWLRPTNPFERTYILGKFCM